MHLVQRVRGVGGYRQADGQPRHAAKHGPCPNEGEQPRVHPLLCAAQVLDHVMRGLAHNAAHAGPSDDGGDHQPAGWGREREGALGTCPTAGASDHGHRIESSCGPVVPLTRTRTLGIAPGPAITALVPNGPTPLYPSGMPLTSFMGLVDACSPRPWLKSDGYPISCCGRVLGVALPLVGAGTCHPVPQPQGGSWGHGVFR